MFGDKHPKGLPYLFFTEMWERFGYYLMIGLFTLYLKAQTDKGGFGLTESEASDLYGTFIAFVFLTPFLGGVIADTKLGYRTSIIIGGLMMGVGYCLMGVHNLYALYLAMALVIFGNGFFKPNISTILGNLYTEPQFKEQKDTGYNIFYMGINIGAFICNFFGAAMKNLFGWQYAFITAGIGMFIGVVIFLIGTKHYIHADVKFDEKQAQKENPLNQILMTILLPAVGFGLLGYFIPITILQSKSTDAFLFACVPIIYYYASLYFKANDYEKRPIGAMLAIFVVSIAFWAVFKQNGTALTTWADRYSDRQVSSGTANVLGSLYLTENVSTKLDSFPKYDNQFRVKKVNGKVEKTLSINPYFQNLSKDKYPQEGESISLVSTNIFQSVNPFWVIALTPVVVGFFSMLRRRGKEPLVPTKMFWGLIISASSMFCMIAAVYLCGNGAEKSNIGWLISTYAVLTVGELCLSPIGLSLVSKLSPPRITAIMMGGWFLATSIGNKLSGVLATMWDGYDNKVNYFWLNFALLIGAALLIFVMLKRLNQVFEEYTK